MKRFDIYIGKEYYGKTFAKTLEEACEQVQRHPKLQGNWPVTVTEYKEPNIKDRILDLYEMNYDTFEEFEQSVMQLLEEEENALDR